MTEQQPRDGSAGHPGVPPGPLPGQPQVEPLAPPVTGSRTTLDRPTRTPLSPQGQPYADQLPFPQTGQSQERQYAGATQVLQTGQPDMSLGLGSLQFPGRVGPKRSGSKTAASSPAPSSQSC
jgi:hypothetical protein